MKTRSTILAAGILAMLVALLTLPSTARAGPYGGVVNPVEPRPGSIIPPPERVPGKEYSHELDKNAANAPDPQQNIAWDGVEPGGPGTGGGVADTFDYNAAPWSHEREEVDAIANIRDALFHELIANQASALFSERVPPGTDTASPIYYEDPAGNIGPWATALQVDQHGVENLDGLEVWGPMDISPGDREGRNDPRSGGLDGPGFDDANMFSLLGDPGPPVGAKTSVFSFTNAGIFPYIPTLAIAAALGQPEDIIDVDALMVYDAGDLGPAGEPIWGPGDTIIFSLWPGPASLIGDAAWVLPFAGPATFLDHGGHDWIDGWNGVNIDALEAVATPEPASMLLLGAGLVGLAGLRRKFKKN